MKKIYLNDLITFCMLIVIIFLPKVNIITVPGSITGIRIEDFLILIYCAIYFFTNKKSTSKEIWKIIKRFSVYIICCLLSLLLGILFCKINLLIGILFLIRKIEYFAFIFIGYRYYKGNKSERKFKILIGFSIIYHFIIIVLQNRGIIGSYRLGSIQEDISGDRLCSIFNGAYEFSAFLLLFLPYYLKNVKNSKLNIVFIIMILVEIYLSQSRTSIIIGLVLIITYWIVEKKIDKRKIGQFILIIPIVMLVASSFSRIYDYLPRFDTLNTKNMLKATEIAWKNRDINRFMEYGTYQLVRGLNVDYSFNIRISKVMNLIGCFLAYPIFGCGIGIIRGPADCNYARILAESGIIGFLTFFALIAYIYRWSKESDNDYSIIIKYSILSLCLGSIFIDLFEASKIMMLFWYIIGFEIKNREELNKRRCHLN